MGKYIASLIVLVLSSAAIAHEDQPLLIGVDGEISGLPPQFSPVKVEITRKANDSAALASVVLSSPRFRIRLNQCVLRRLVNVQRVEASASWYHDLERSPPYISFSFHSSPAQLNPEFYAVTFSLVDGRILSGQRARDPWWGSWRGRVVDPADKCGHWEPLGLWPNNSFKPTPLRGAA